MNEFDINSMYAHVIQMVQLPIPKFKILADAIVDDEQWYTVRIYRPEIMEWVNEQNPLWRDELRDTYPYGRQWDVHEKLFMLMSLKWS